MYLSNFNQINKYKNYNFQINLRFLNKREYFSYSHIHIHDDIYLFDIAKR